MILDIFHTEERELKPQKPIQKSLFWQLTPSNYWGRYFLFLAICLPLMSGCRLGNRIESQPSESEDSVSGYYTASPKRLILYATLQDQTYQQEVDVSFIPTWLSKYMTNPVLFVLLDPKTGLAGITSPTSTSSALPVYYDQDAGLSYEGASQAQVHWRDEGCLSFLAFTARGVVVPSTTVENPAGNTYPLSGSITLNAQVATLFEGSCEDTFRQISECYADVSLCGESNDEDNALVQQTVIRAYAPWIESGFLVPSELADLKNYAYEVFYE